MPLFGLRLAGVRFVALVLMLAIGSACQINGGDDASTATAVASSPTQATSLAAATASPSTTTPSPTAAATQARGQATPVASPTAPAAARDDLTTAIRQVVQQVRPAVVQVTNLQEVQSGQFGQPYTVPAGVGSGVIYDNQGHILTNHHVVEGAQQLSVSLPDGRTFDGTVVGTDTQTDLAVIQISGANLPVAKIGDSKKLQVGDWVVAIGNALGLPGGPTVTVGVVSALDRTVQEPGSRTGGAGPYLFDVIQTDAPINPGNSGGPLINLDGEVVGINTLVAGGTETGYQAQGIGFAVGSATAKPIADQLVATGRVIHPYVGVSYVPLNPAIAAQLDVNVRQGVLVQRVEAGSPAESAGLKARDIITEADGQTLVEESAFAYAIERHKPGETITFTVLRDGQTLTIQVKLGERPQ